MQAHTYQHFCELRFTERTDHPIGTNGNSVTELPVVTDASTPGLRRVCIQVGGLSGPEAAVAGNTIEHRL